MNTQSSILLCLFCWSDHKCYIAIRLRQRWHLCHATSNSHISMMMGESRRLYVMPICFLRNNTRSKNDRNSWRKKWRKVHKNHCRDKYRNKAQFRCRGGLSGGGISDSDLSAFVVVVFFFFIASRQRKLGENSFIRCQSPLLLLLLLLLCHPPP